MRGLYIDGDQLWQITSPHFVAGLSVGHDGVVTAAAPIIYKWAFNRPFDYVRRYVARKGWTMTIVRKAD